MISSEDSMALVQASLYFHELFKKTILACSPPFAMTRTQMDLLVTLYNEGPSSMSALSDRVGIAPEQATRAVKNLRERGLAQTARGEENRRLVIADLTEEGRLFMDDHVRDIVENLRAALAGLDEQEAGRLATAAADVVRLMRKTALKHAVSDPQAKDG